MEESDDNFVKCLSVPSNLRTLQDISCIRSHFKSIEAIKCYKDLTISEFARIARYEHYEAHCTLYHHGDVCQSWYIVLSGCVLVGQTMFFPRKSFGHRSQGNLYRYDECMILEETELIVFDYAMDRHAQTAPISRKLSYNSSSIREIDSIADSNLTLSNALLNSPYNGSSSKRSSHASDTSSAFSGCEVLSDNTNSKIGGTASYASDNDDDDDDHDIDSLSQDIYSLNDSFYDVILKEPQQRSETDIDTILEGVQNLSAFGNFTSKTKRELCKVMRVAIVSSAEEKLMEDGHVHDTWNVILDGSVEVRYRDGSVREFSRGDSFGVRPTLEEQRQIGDMWTISASCLFFCVLQREFCDIIGRNSENIIPETEDNDGRVVLVYEERGDKAGGGRVVVKGTVEKLIGCLLVDQNKTDPMYVETFLVTYRVFLRSPRMLAEKLCQWYEGDAPGLDTRTKATIRKCLLLWANNHFADFDDPNADMEEYLERIDNMLSDGPYSANDRSLFFMACGSNSNTRFLTVNIEKNYMKKLPFRLIGLQRGWGLFVKEINRATGKASSCGLRRGDQILSLANYSWERLDSLDKAVDMLNSCSSCSINIVVKYNPSGFQEVLDDLAESESGIEYDGPTTGSLSMSGSVTLHGISDHLRSGLNCVITPMAVPRPNEFMPTRDKSNTRSAHTSPNRQVVRQRSKPKCNSLLDKGHSTQNKPLRSLNNRSCSNPDLKPFADSLIASATNNLCNASQVLKVFRSNSDSKLVLLSNNTTAKEAVPLIMKEFSIDASEIDNHALYLVSVDVGVTGPVVKSSRVALYMRDLAGKLALNQRYYLKHNQHDSQLITDEQAKLLLNETKVTLNQLSAFEISTRLTFIDYALFRGIQSAEYINFTLKLPPLEDIEKAQNPSPDLSKPPDQSKNTIEGFSTGCENYDKFEDLINRESFWPTSEICAETNVSRRADLIKKFIKVAKMCKDLKNFNSLMCIITGLTLTPVSRLKSSWDKVPSKYIKIYEELSDLTDMSFNFRQIRQLVSPEMNEPPLVPCLAIHSKDLATMHMGNKTCTKDGLINFEKLRMMASEVRKLTTMCSSGYSLQTILAAARSRTAPGLFGVSSPGIVLNPSLDESDATSGISGCSNNSDSYSKKARSNSVDQFAFNGTLKKKYIKRKSLSVIESQTKNPKKIYDEWLSTLKVRTYLSNLHVEMNINRLQDLSHSLEPAASITSSSSNISSAAASLESSSTDLTAHSKASATKSSVTITLSQSKPQTTIAPAPVPPSINTSSPPAVPKHLSPVNNIPKPKTRPQSIFSYQNPEDVDKLMELVQLSKKVPKRRQIGPGTDGNGRSRTSNAAGDQNYLRNVPLYHNNKQLIHDLSVSSQQGRQGGNHVPGGKTINIQQSLPDCFLEAPLSDKGYCYPVAGGAINNYYYGGDRNKCMKPNLPSYEAARAISQHQKLITNCCPVLVPTDSVSARPPQCPKAILPPQLPSYNQYVARNTLPQEPPRSSAPPRRTVPPPPPPPPRTVTMPPQYRPPTPSTVVTVPAAAVAAARKNQSESLPRIYCCLPVWQRDVPFTHASYLADG